MQVPFGKKLLTGIVVEHLLLSSVPDSKLKTIEICLDASPFLQDKQRHFLQWASAYYHHPLGQVIFSSMPKSYKEGKTPTPPTPLAIPMVTQRPFELNEEQRIAARWFPQQMAFACAVLEGVTGSGKTEVYQEAMATLFEKQQQALMLIPEIGLFPQTFQRLEKRFPGRVIAFHSGLTEKERRAAWWHVQHTSPLVVLSTRSGVFLPFHCLGGIFVDEEHDASYKQSDGFRYHGRDCAVFLARTWNVPIILGSATPSLSTLHNLKRQRYERLQLSKRTGTAQLPTVSFIEAPLKAKEGGLSLTLRKAIQKHLDNQHQVLLFLNRRGFAPALWCRTCHWSAACTHCSAKMTVHQGLKKLWCHHCDAQKSIPTACPTCGDAVNPVGFGTERLEETLALHFPDTALIRIDSDSTRLKNSFEEKLAQIQAASAAIIVGTQMIAKGHHFPKVTLVAVIDVDGGLFSADYQATERMGQLVTQVSGRSGRGELSGEVLLQTAYPNHPWLQQLLTEGYGPFALSLLQERLEASLPPHTAMAVVHASARQATFPFQFLTVPPLPALQIIGPLPSPLPKKAGLYRAQLIILADNRTTLQKGVDVLMRRLKESHLSKKVRWSLDVDPLDLFS